MDIDEYSVKELLLAAIKGEIGSNDVYLTLAGKVGNAFLRDRLHFLAKEEVKHRYFLEGIYQKEFPGEDIMIPDRSPVPLPLIIVDKNTINVSQVIEKAMGAEKAAHDFYVAMAPRFDDDEVRSKFKYLAKMEFGHYKILEHELESLLEFEDYLSEWPMMNLGP